MLQRLSLSRSLTLSLDRRGVSRANLGRRVVEFDEGPCRERERARWEVDPRLALEREPRLAFAFFCLRVGFGV